MIVIVVNSYQGGWFDFHVDFIDIHIISKALEKDQLKFFFEKDRLKLLFF